MSFRSFKNKNWTFRGSFDNLSAFFSRFFREIRQVTFIIVIREDI
jgi:hypothetical protein